MNFKEFVKLLQIKENLEDNIDNKCKPGYMLIDEQCVLMTKENLEQKIDNLRK